MKIEQIEQFIEIVFCGSISKAAQNLYMFQPNLSLSMHNLEAELGHDIFDRSSQGVKLTNFGRDFLSYAQPIYNQYLALKDMCHSSSEKPAPSFFVSSQFFKFVNSTFITLYKKYIGKNIHFALYEEPFFSVVKSVSSQQSELGVIMLLERSKPFSRLLKSNDIDYTKLAGSMPHAIIGPNNPLYKKELPFITLDMLKGFPFITYQQEYGSFYDYARFLRPLGTLDYITVSDRATLIEFIANTDAFLIAAHNLSAYSNNAYYPNIKALPIQGIDVGFEIGWIKHKNHQLSNIGEEFLGLLEEGLMNTSKNSEQLHI